jgi:hypothetical protein
MATKVLLLALVGCAVVAAVAGGAKKAPKKVTADPHKRCQEKLTGNTCFLAGSASNQGYEDDDTPKAMNTPKGRAHYQCVDCVLRTPGVETWGCTILELRTWCVAATDTVFEEPVVLATSGADKLQTMRLEMMKNKGVKAGPEEMKAFTAKHQEEITEAEKRTNKALEVVMKKFGKFFKKHPEFKYTKENMLSEVYDEHTTKFYGAGSKSSYSLPTKKEKKAIWKTERDIQKQLIVEALESKKLEDNPDSAHSLSKDTHGLQPRFPSVKDIIAAYKKIKEENGKGPGAGKKASNFKFIGKKAIKGDVDGMETEAKHEVKGWWGDYVKKIYALGNNTST